MSLKYIERDSSTDSWQRLVSGLPRQIPFSAAYLCPTARLPRPALLSRLLSRVLIHYAVSAAPGTAARGVNA